MTLQALLVSADDSAADVLGRVLPTLGLAMDRLSDRETTLARIQQQKFEALIVDFDDPKAADDVLQLARRLGSGPLTVALVGDAAKVRRERRRAIRVPVQAPVTITMPNDRKVDGILLDLSETSMDVLTAEPQMPGALLAFRFEGATMSLYFPTPD